MVQLFAIIRERFRFFLLLCAIIIAYLYSYQIGYRNSLTTFACLVTVASLPWLFRSLADRAAPRNGEAQPTGLWLPPWDATTQLRVNEFLAFSAVVGFGIFLRFWRWDFVPHGLSIDEFLYTANGLRVLDGNPIDVQFGKRILGIRREMPPLHREGEHRPATAQDVLDPLVAQRTPTGVRVTVRSHLNCPEMTDETFSVLDAKGRRLVWNARRPDEGQQVIRRRPVAIDRLH